jgi:putative NADH-flavin reductase
VHIAVFGANGPTGRLLTAQALAHGHSVAVVTRRPDEFPLRAEGLRVVAGNVLDQKTTQGAVDGTAAVLSTLGVPFGRKPISIYSAGTAAIIKAMRVAGVNRFACVSSSATDPAQRHRDTGGGFLFEKALKPLITTTLGRTLYEDMLRMENLVTASDLDWTIIRPSGLFETAGVTDYRTADSFIAGRYTSRADLADLLLRQLTETAYLRKAVAVATFAEQPSVWQLIRNEAIGTKSSGKVPVGQRPTVRADQPNAASTACAAATVSSAVRPDAAGARPPLDNGPSATSLPFL